MSSSGILGLYLAVICFAGVSSQMTEPIVTVTTGEVRGKFEPYEDVSKGKFSSFRGIPYAKPPTDSMRLKEPEKPEGWSTPWDATNFRSECPQVDSRGNVIGNEDCLFINVYTPYQPRLGGSKPNTLYPVMVFVHGGNFQRGSSKPYGPERFVQSGVVLVTFNYRLGVLGFLSTGDAACPGNLGLKDQVLALEWVRDNIASFAGDSSLVTLFGQGAGAASVFMHILSPKSEGLFLRAITQSGSPVCDWTLEENPYTYAVEIAKNLGCSTKSTGAMVDCIRAKPLGNILNAQKDNKTFGDYPLRAVAVVEKEKEGFLTDTPDKLLSSKRHKIPLLSGVNRDDGAFFYPLINSYREVLSKNSSFLQTQLLPMFLLTATDIRGNIESVSQALMFDYFNGVDPSNVTAVLQPFTNMSTDSMFVSCNYKTVQLYSAAADAPVYMYAFQYRGAYSMLNLEQKDTVANFQGVSHGDELLYLFKMAEAPLTASNDNLKSEQLLYLWTTFAKTGASAEEVSLEFPKWEPYTNSSKNYYHIDEKIESRLSYRQRYVDLWLDHLPALAKLKPGNQKLEYRIGSFGWSMFAIALILLVVTAVLAVLLFRKSKTQYSVTKQEDK